MKELFVWNQTYELGIQTIDEQHKKWLGIMNKLYNSFVKKEASDKVLSIIKEMEDYTIYHFSSEERFFKQFGFIQESAHLKLHNDFKLELKKLKTEYEKSPLSLTYKLMTFMQTWLRAHILEADKQYVSLLKGKI